MAGGRGEDTLRRASWQPLYRPCPARRSIERDGRARCGIGAAPQAIGRRAAGPSTTQADADRIKAKPKMSAAVGRSPRIRIELMTPIAGLPRAPRDAVAAGSRRTISNHMA